MAVTVQDRIADIEKRCGLSENIIRRVLNAEADSIIDTLKKGERATLIGRVTITPSMGKKLEVGGNVRDTIKLSCKATNSLKARLQDIEEYEDIPDDDTTEILKKKNPGIKTVQIAGLL